MNREYTFWQFSMSKELQKKHNLHIFWKDYRFI